MDPRAYSDADDGGVSRPLRLVTLGCLVLAAATLWLAMPRFFAAIAAAPHHATVVALGAEPAPSDAAVARALAGKLLALDWHSAPRHHADAGALLLHRARIAATRGDGDAARAALVASIDRHRAALRMAPVQPYAWTRLVQAEVALGLAPQIVAAHLRLAILAAPREPALVVPRLGPALTLWPALDATTRALAAEQIRRAARWFPSALARQARRTYALETVLSVLADDADLTRRFAEAYARL